MHYFHRFIVYLDRPISVPLLPEINYSLFSLVADVSIMSVCHGLTGRMFVRPNILRTLRRTMIRFLIEHLVRRRNMVRTVQTLLHSQLACNEMQASARTCGRRAADSMIENVG